MPSKKPVTVIIPVLISELKGDGQPTTNKQQAHFSFLTLFIINTKCLLLESAQAVVKKDIHVLQVGFASITPVLPLAQAVVV
ncbi:MAG: hypothetical protein EXX96DRAFT_615267 [Benjaminiella poitrasii]|nr:MAG: hypothetical protein EXX96DRAFT_615267 [Benjaminiella poitrasii]